MKASELRAKSRDELKSEILGLRKEMMNLRFQQANFGDGKYRACASGPS